MKYYFDFDDTLVRTRHLYPRTKGRPGRNFIAQNPNSVETNLVNPNLVDLIKEIANDVVVVSNSPENLVTALMNKHGFPEVPIIGSAKKPCLDLSGEEAVVIGDSPSDIYFARHNSLPSIAYLEASPFSNQQMSLSAPSSIVSDFTNLVTKLGEDLPVLEAFNPDDYIILNSIRQEDFPTFPVGDYYPVGTDGYKASQLSKNILSYKSAKNFSWEEIVFGKKDSYYYENNFRYGTGFQKIINSMYTKFLSKLKELDLNGSVKILSVPNSMPEHAYLCDPNEILAYSANRKQGNRIIQRLIPVPSAHSTGLRDYSKHMGSIGIRKQTVVNSDNVVLIDDIMTSKAQMFSTASLLRNVGYKGKIHCVPLGRTINSN